MATPLEIAVGVSVEIFFAAVALGILYRVWGGIFAVPKKYRVLPFQRGVILKDEKIEKVVELGTYWITPKRTLVICDMRPKPFQLAGLELISADGMAIRMSFGIEYQVTDPGAFVTQTTDTYAAFYVDLRQAIYVAVRELNSRVILSDATSLLARIQELVTPRSVLLGVTLAKLDLWEVMSLGWHRPLADIESNSQPIQ